MPIQLSGSLVITGSITTTGVITMSGSIASASYSSTSDLLQGTGSVGFTTTASFNAVSSSQQQISSSQQQISASLLNVIAVYATTGSNSFRADQSITGSLVVSSTITAQTLVVQTVTSSIVYSSGSNNFGNQVANTQTFTGSVNITGSSHSIFGNVGIGTNAPTRLLDVSNTSGDSTIVITSADATGQSSLFYGKPSDANIGGVLYNHCNNQMSFRVNDTTKMSITSTGNVGIGTCTPSTLLQTNQTGTTGYFYSGQQNGTEIAYWYYNATEIQFSSKAAARALAFLTNDTPRMTITCTGVLNLSGPSQKIYSNNETTSYAYFQLDNTGGSLTMGIERSTGGGLANCTSVYSGYIGTNNATALSFGTNVTERMRITSTGVVEMNACDATYIRFSYLGTSKGFIGVAGATTDIISGAAAGDMTIRAQQKMQFATGGDTPRMTITCGGSVSIGSTSTPYNFNVYGATSSDGFGAFFGATGTTKGGIYIGNAGNQYGTLYFDNANNNVYLKQSYVTGCVIVIANTGGAYLANGGTSWAPISSDVRKKKNFETTQGLAEVLQIEPIKYHFNEDNNNSIKRIGFKAQNIKPLIPEMVLETGEFAEDGSPYLTITSDYILPVLVKAMQEQHCTICSQASRITLLESCLGIA